MKVADDWNTILLYHFVEKSEVLSFQEKWRNAVKCWVSVFCLEKFKSMIWNGLELLIHLVHFFFLKRSSSTWEVNTLSAVFDSFFMTSLVSKCVTESTKSSEIWKKICFSFSISTVPADDIAPLGARPSAGAVMTEFKSHLVLKVKIWCPISSNSTFVMGSIHRLLSQ